jgi:hypothetical protein
MRSYVKEMARNLTEMWLVLHNDSAPVYLGLSVQIFLKKNCSNFTVTLQLCSLSLAEYFVFLKLIV